MKPSFILLFSTCAALAAVACGPDGRTLSSPDGRIVVTVDVAQGHAFYSVSRDGKPMLDDSPLGIATSAADFTGGVLLAGSSPVRPFARSFDLHAGKTSRVDYRANEREFTLENDRGQRCSVLFRVSDDGVAFAYRLPGEGTTQVLGETSGFALPRGATAFLSPMARAKSGWARTNPSYEDHYTHDMTPGTPSEYGAGWVLPALFRLDDDRWLLVSETGVGPEYTASHLAETASGESTYRIEFAPADHNLPQDDVCPTVPLPFTTPWRSVALGSLETLFENTLAQALAEPRYPDRGVYRPGRATWSWLPLKDEATVFDVQKRFVEMAHRLGYEYCLVDALWDTQIGYDRMAELSDYARTLGVGLLLWYNSNGDWNDAPQSPRDRMNTPEARRQEMEWMQRHGIKGIKVDFFGGDKQAAMRLYDEILRDADRYGLYVNFHGTTLPRGWDVMYPNFATGEAVMGMEYVTFDQHNADLQPQHCTDLVFTRNVTAPMDFTPLMLNTRLAPDGRSGVERRTTAAFELALPVLFTSSVTHIGLTPENLATLPDEAIRYLALAPAAWNESRLLSGYPGRDAVVARRSGERWFVAGINGENRAKTLSFTLPAGAENRPAVLITDGPQPNSLQAARITTSARTEIEVGAHGGFVLYGE